LEVGREDLSTVLDCHVRFTPRASVRPEEILAMLLPKGDHRTADIERSTLWAEANGRRLDPLELLYVREPGIARDSRIPA
jgi:hypothetical protein